MISQYSTVVVTEIRHPPAFYNPFKVNTALPQVGDRGAVVDVLRGFGQPDRYIVECVNASSETIWLSDFSADELALAPPEA
jgi:hypothetical protein